MIKINLVAEAPTAATVKKKKGPEISLGAKQGDMLLLISVLIFAAIGGGVWLKMKGERDDLKAERSAKQTERDSLQQYIDRVEELEARRAQLKRKVEVINNLKTNQQGPVKIMDETSKALPELVWLDRLDLKGNSLTLSGMAMDENAVANLISNLDASPFFQEPSLVELAASRNETFKFRLTVIFTYKAEIAGEEEATG
jgi:type IV pilus assembly protein PilN